MLQCRPASIDDAPALARLNQQLIRDEGHRNPMPLVELETRMRGWLGGGYEASLFVEDGETAGYALYRREPEHVYLRQFFVTPECRRQGVGRTAFGWLRTTAWRGEQRVRLEVLIGNGPAIAFWLAVGFRDYCLVMEQELPTD
jgi:GNAT superfamily N-acetyltransferase